MSQSFPDPNPLPREPEILRDIQRLGKRAALRLFECELIQHYRIPWYGYIKDAKLQTWTPRADPSGTFMEKKEVAQAIYDDAVIRLWNRLRNGKPFAVYQYTTFWRYLKKIAWCVVADYWRGRPQFGRHRPKPESFSQKERSSSRKSGVRRKYWERLKADSAFVERARALLSRTAQEAWPQDLLAVSERGVDGDKDVLRGATSLLLAELKELTSRQRDCFALHVMGSLRYREIADALRISTEAVGVYIWEARQSLIGTLCRYLSAQGYAPGQIADILGITDKLDAQGNVILDRVARVQMFLNKDDASD